jgi:hypothetical protein
MKKSLIVLLVIIVLVVVAVEGYVVYQNYLFSKVAPNLEAWKTYKNTELGFGMIFPDSWRGYTVVSQTWQGNAVDNFDQKYSGPEIVFKNPQTTPQQSYQDIPMMVFTKDQWSMVSGNNPTVAISAAPIGPAEVGQNAKYVFATPPRWYGFTDAIGFQEAVDIVKTFKTF